MWYDAKTDCFIVILDVVVNDKGKFACFSVNLDKANKVLSAEPLFGLHDDLDRLLKMIHKKNKKLLDIYTDR
jgi:hypothetical protein